MAMLRVVGKREPKRRLGELEKRFDLKDIEKKLERLDLKELEKALERIDLKELEKRLDTDVAGRYRELLGRRRAQKRKASSGRFIAGLVIGLVVGVALALVMGRRQNGGVLDQVAQQADTLKDTASDRYQQLRGDQAGQAGTNEAFGGEAAIEREINGTDDVVDSARDTIDSASEDVQSSIEEIQSEGEDSSEDGEARVG